MPREPLPLGGLGTIRIDRLPNGHWQAVAYTRDKDGIRRRMKATAPTRAKARTLLIARHTSRTPPQAKTLNGSTKLHVAAKKWLDQVESSDRKYATKRIYKNVVKTHITPLIGALLLREITPSQVQEFLSVVAKPRKIGDKTVGGTTTAKHCKVALSQIMTMCVLDGAVTHNSVDAAKMNKNPQKSVTALSPEQIQEIRDNVRAWGTVRAPGPPRNATLMLDFLDVLTGTGCRPGEVLALRWEDVDLENGTIRITGTIVYTEAGVTRQETAKTTTSIRWFKIPEFTVQVLRLRYMRTADKSGPVFATRAGTYFQDSNMRRLWRSARGEKWAHVSFAHYRKAVATLIERAEGMAAAADQLGHSSPEITRRYYVERAEMVDFSAVVAAMAPSESSPIVAPSGS
ncbi:tyrosine-type recombinase/integrase [Rothia koreensis]|uniref:tyrosine-type recombinase/integrase n=1 Tax=Rothia koreensis TaxID=592378 RepID=UPI003FCEC359